MREEAAAIFIAGDVNGDGELSFAEFKVHPLDVPHTPQYAIPSQYSTPPWQLHATPP